MMKIKIKELFIKAKDYFIKHHVVIVIVMAVFGGIVGFTGMVAYNQTSTFCQSCHTNRGTYFSLDLNIPAHKGINNGGKNCLSCHSDKALEMQVFNSIKKIPQYSQRVANLAIQDQVHSKQAYNDDDCMQCHPEILELEQVPEYALPLRVKDLGVKYSHDIHYRFKYFQPEDEERWKTLLKKGNLTEEDQEEFALLEKIRHGNCESCHNQQKVDEFGNKYVDKTVNFTARNPIGCIGCHEEARPTVHPGNEMEFPTKETCYKCHHGKLHGKFVIFLADCEGEQGKEHCVKCHPQYQQEKDIQFVIR